MEKTKQSKKNRQKERKIIAILILISLMIFFGLFIKIDGRNNFDECVQDNAKLQWSCLEGCYNALLIVFNKTTFDYDATERVFYDECADKCGDMVQYELCQDYLR